MKTALLMLLALCGGALSAPVEQLHDFTLTDQHATARGYRFPKAKITVMTVADHEGSAQLEPWIQRLYDRYREAIDIDGIADVSMIANPFHGIFRQAFRKQLKRSVLLDWEGNIVKQFDYEKGVPNLYVIDRDGRILKAVRGPVNEAGFRSLVREIDAAR